MQYTDRGPAEHFRLRSQAIDVLACDGGRATVTGVATIDDQVLDFTFELLDAGEPGRADTYRLQLSNGYDSGTGTVAAGNIQVRAR